MKNLFLVTSLMAGMLLASLTVQAADPAPAAPAAPAAAPAAPTLKDPSVEQRLADLEAYVNNGARSCVADTNITSKVSGPGPGHNGWMMTSAALVLFMTLP